MITLENLKGYFELQEQNNPIVIASSTDLLEVIRMEGVVYGFRISVEQDGSSSVSYLEDAIGATPAFMDFSTGRFNYGSWENAFFMPKPCMLKFDGTVDYYLDPDDFDYRSDGVTPSDVANENYEGNAMIEWNKIWYKIVPLEGRDGCADIFISDHKADRDYVCYSFIDNNGNEKDHFYTPIYNGTAINVKLRSLSAKIHSVNGHNFDVLCKYAERNGDGWCAETYVDRVLINCLLVLMGKSLDLKKIYGYGHYTGGKSASSNYKTGLLNRRGMFWGDTNNSGVKVFGMENYYGEVWRVNLGVMDLKGKYYIKLHGPYNTTGEGYTEAGNVPNATNKYITKMNFDNNIMLPIAVGPNNTYCTDGMFSNNYHDTILWCGGCSGNGLIVGPFTINFSNGATYTYWGTGVSCTYR